MFEVDFALNNNIINVNLEMVQYSTTANLELNVTPDRTSMLINDSDYVNSTYVNNYVGDGTISFEQDNEIIGSLTANQKTNSTIKIGQSGTKVIWKVY